MITEHADVVGSLLRPSWLLQAQQDFAAGLLTQAVFKRLEDRAVDEAIILQEEAGMRVVTDGEMRRQSFQDQIAVAVDGFGEVTLDSFLWGEWHGDAEIGNRNIKRPSSMGVIGKLKRRRHLAAEEFTYLRARTKHLPKVTLPSPSLMSNFWSRNRSKDVYPTLDDFLADVTSILRDEVKELARLGAQYIQLDAPHYPLLVDPQMRAFYEARGWKADQWLANGIELDNQVMADFPEITFGFHL
jgi:5-methyltetrahydropteroyltriglutamate--homocysteine methyltransferase